MDIGMEQCPPVIVRAADNIHDMHAFHRQEEHEWNVYNEEKKVIN